MEAHKHLFSQPVWRQLRDVVQDVQSPRLGRWRHTHTTHPDDLCEVGYLFLMHYLLKVVAFKLIIMIFNYLCAIMFRIHENLGKNPKFRVLPCTDQKLWLLAISSLGVS